MKKEHRDKLRYRFSIYSQAFRLDIFLRHEKRVAEQQSRAAI